MDVCTPAISLDHIARCRTAGSWRDGAAAIIPDAFSWRLRREMPSGWRGWDTAPCAMVVGDDQAGREYIRYLGQSGVNVENVVQMAEQQTSHSYLFLNPDGQYQNFFFPGAADAWRGELALHRIEQYRFALVTVGALHYNRQFVRCVRQAGVPLVWALKADIHTYPPGLLGEFLTASAYVLMNHIEADYVIQALGKESIVQCLNDPTRAILVTT
jgi:sugar/nucleoside kinase (ribokinase family)